MSTITVSTTIPIPIVWPIWGIVIAIVVPVALIQLFIAGVVALCVTCYFFRKRRLHELTHLNVRFPRHRDVPTRPPNSARHTRAQLVITTNFSQPGEYASPSVRVANGKLKQARLIGNETASNHWRNSTATRRSGQRSVSGTDMEHAYSAPETRTWKLEGHLRNGTRTTTCNEINPAVANYKWETVLVFHKHIQENPGNLGPA